MIPRRNAQATRPVDSPLFLDQHFLRIAGLLLAIMGAVQIGSAIQENPTNDEPIHLTAGYVYLTTGEYSMELEHPPLGRMLAALPLLRCRSSTSPRKEPGPNSRH